MRAVVTNYFAMERWLNDNIPVAGETFREFVKKLYQNDELVRGELRLGARRIDLGQITCPLLLLTAKNDHLVAPASTEGIRPHVASRDVKSMMIEAGHVGLVVGGKAQKTFWPAATRWVADRSVPGTGASPVAVSPGRQLSPRLPQTIRSWFQISRVGTSHAEWITESGRYRLSGGR